MYKNTAILASLLALFISACSTIKTDKTADWSARRIYQEAKQSLSDGKFAEAVNYFELLEARYPFGQYALQAQLDVAYAYYKREEYDLALDAADRFIRLHPRNPHIDYAYYLKGLADFSRGSGILSSLFGRELAETDQTAVRNAFASFDSLIQRFPDGIYTDDARQRMVFLRNKMAEHELSVAHFYYRRGALLATINRINYLIEHFDGALVVPDALALLAQAYESMGMDQLSSDALRVLAKNAPHHEALKDPIE